MARIQWLYKLVILIKFNIYLLFRMYLYFTFSTRLCDNPKPVGGGLFCAGGRRRHRTCQSGTECSQVFLRKVMWCFTMAAKGPFRLPYKTMWYHASDKIQLTKTIIITIHGIMKSLDQWTSLEKILFSKLCFKMENYVHIFFYHIHDIIWFCKALRDGS